MAALVQHFMNDGNDKDIPNWLTDLCRTTATKAKTVLNELDFVITRPE